MTKKDPKIIRVGDMVKIINPEFFVRCGYPMDFNDAYEHIDRNHNAPMHELIKSMIPEAGPVRKHKVYEKLVRIFAYEYMRSKKFGGPERKIYTMRIRKQLLKVYRVLDIRFVKTGIYYPGDLDNSEGIAYLDQLPYLDKEKTHKLLQLDCLATVDGIVEPFDWMEARNVRKENV